MEQFLTKTWNNYKSLTWWKKVLLFLPILLVGIGYLYFSFYKIDNVDNYSKAVASHKKIIDKQIEKKLKKESDLAKAEKKIEKEQIEIKKEIEKDTVYAKETITRIENASITHNIDEFKLIQSNLRNKARARRSNKS